MNLPSSTYIYLAASFTSWFYESVFLFVYAGSYSLSFFALVLFPSVLCWQVVLRDISSALFICASLTHCLSVLWKNSGLFYICISSDWGVAHLQNTAWRLDDGHLYTHTCTHMHTHRPAFEKVPLAIKVLFFTRMWNYCWGFKHIRIWL